ncbi:MAG: NUDIX domain-containing protein [Clostridia bacterium]|nr:NUDIX domain-containing protein [Clostridia bacterium]
MAEIWELVDEQKRKTGILHERAYSEQIPKGFYHIVVEIWTKTRDGELLLTQRHPQKPMGLLWECTMGSVVVGEESREGAARELAEETGIYAREEDLIYLGDTFHSNWIVDSYLYLPEEKPALRLFTEGGSRKCRVCKAFGHGQATIRDRGRRLDALLQIPREN